MRLISKVSASNGILCQWEGFYKKVFPHLTVDFSKVRIPKDPGGFPKVLVIAKRLTLNQTIKACRDHFKVYSY